ncbi:MAG: hypothetical protein U1A78_17275 [Polyangia bacterium]
MAPRWPWRWAPDGRHLLITDTSAEATGYDASTARAQYVLSGHRDRVTQAALSPDGRWLASVSYDGALQLWQP